MLNIILISLMCGIIFTVSALIVLRPETKKEMRILYMSLFIGVIMMATIDTVLAIKRPPEAMRCDCETPHEGRTHESRKKLTEEHGCKAWSFKSHQ